MIKLQFYLMLCALAHAAYYSRMATVNRIRGPSVFRPGVNMQGLRQPYPPRFVQAASHRAPYVVYRNSPHRYAMKHYGPATRNAFPPGWKTTARLPPASPVTPEYDFIRAASAPTRLHADGTGAIHTIPAPNLSLSEKPIVVIEEIVSSKPPTSEAPQATYEVTEKYADPMYQMTPKIELPVGFSKATSLTSQEIQSLIRNGAALQFASEYGLNAIALPHQIQPQHFTVQGFSSLPNQHDLIHAGAESIVIQPQALYQPDPLFLQKLQNQLMQKYPAIEFVPYPADIAQAPVNSHPQTQGQSQMFLLQNEEITKQTPTAFEPQKNVVQREAQESSVVTLVPQGFVLNNVTENLVEVTSASAPQNVTLELLSEETHPGTTTVKYVIEHKEQDQSTTPLYYAQVGQSVGNIVANGFYSAINDVRAAAAIAQVEKPTEPNTRVENLTTTTINSDMKNYFVQNSESSQNVTELKPILGVPFTKKADSVNVAYTLVRADENDPKVNQEGAVYAGQLVEATISEDHDFNIEKESLMSRRAPLRLFTVEKKDTTTTTTTTTTNPPPKVTVIKKIPPRSKLTFDDKTGEPVLRIYASYIDSPLQELLASKLANIKLKDVIAKKDSVDNWKSATVNAVEKSQGPDANQVTQFGIKLRSRSDDYIPLFEEYEE
ncbi:uncharacterized protein LOC128671309 isoform X2 [Plodia interpunctella]|uniref:uncharacterized protein LOC128671309 isoform X2 n=1 Tax=Plodia interpunctella TaxID=58824 RepID=UPI002367F411|nr:uncharacterized protein LOC128671309 isoform X2 [Plodia interpunctella]